MDTQTNITSIKSFSRSGISDLLSSFGQPSFRTGQLIEWLYQNGASSYDEMTNLPKRLRDSLASEFPLHPSKVVDRQTSIDGTRKYLIAFHDGCLVETVGIPSNDGRLTVCFSTQVGCAMGCVFCATGKEGFTRNLLIGEIIDQILIVQKDFNARVSNLVGMGQGEPFLNFDAVLSALDIINSKQSLNIGARKITLSTCGIIKGIRRFATVQEQYTLAISLHAARQEVRDELMPFLSSNPLHKLKEALLEYTQITNRRVTLEYTLINKLNDSSDDLNALISFADGLLCHINIIRLNRIPDSPFQPSSMHTMDNWKARLEEHGIPVSIRISKGSDISGACGQLKNQRA